MLGGDPRGNQKSAARRRSLGSWTLVDRSWNHGLLLKYLEVLWLTILSSASRNQRLAKHRRTRHAMETVRHPSRCERRVVAISCTLSGAHAIAHPVNHSEQPIDMGGLGVVSLVLVIFRTYVSSSAGLFQFRPSSPTKHFADLQSNQQIAGRPSPNRSPSRRSGHLTRTEVSGHSIPPRYRS